MELGVLDLLLTLKTTVISYLLQQCFWGGGQAGFAPRGAAIEALQMSGTEGYALPGSFPALWFLLGCLHHLSLQSPGLLPFVEGHHVIAKLI
jgi:hypothetical protein